MLGSRGHGTINVQIVIYFPTKRRTWKVHKGNTEFNGSKKLKRPYAVICLPLFRFCSQRFPCCSENWISLLVANYIAHWCFRFADKSSGNTNQSICMFPILQNPFFLFIKMLALFFKRCNQFCPVPVSSQAFSYILQSSWLIFKYTKTQRLKMSIPQKLFSPP